MYYGTSLNTLVKLALTSKVYLDSWTCTEVFSKVQCK